MYEFMIERFGERAPLELMDLYAEGVREEDAFRRVMGVGGDEFLAMFLPWAHGQVRAWGLAPEPDLRVVRFEGYAATEAGGDAVRERLRSAATSGARRTARLSGAEVEPLQLPRPDEAQARAWLERYPDRPGALEAAVQIALFEARARRPTRSCRCWAVREGRPVDRFPTGCWHAFSQAMRERFAPGVLDARGSGRLRTPRRLARAGGRRPGERQPAPSADGDRAFNAELRELAASRAARTSGGGAHIWAAPAAGADARPAQAAHRAGASCAGVSAGERGVTQRMKRCAAWAGFPVARDARVGRGSRP